MLYGIQNSFGEVYGTFDMPPTDQSAEVWAAELRTELGSLLGINGVRDVPLVTTVDGAPVKVPRVIIDIEPIHADLDERIGLVHHTISRMAVEHSIRR